MVTFPARSFPRIESAHPKSEDPMDRRLRIAPNPEDINNSDGSIAVSLDLHQLVHDPGKLRLIRIPDEVLAHFSGVMEVALYPGDALHPMITTMVLTVTERYVDNDGRDHYVVHVNIAPNHGGSELKNRLIAVPPEKVEASRMSGRTLVPMDGTDFQALMDFNDSEDRTRTDMLRTLKELAWRLCKLEPPCWSQVRVDYALTPDHDGVLRGDHVYDYSTRTLAATIAPRIEMANLQKWQRYQAQKFPFYWLYLLLGGKPMGLRPVPDVPNVDIWKDDSEGVDVGLAEELIGITLGMKGLLTSLSLQIFEANPYVKKQINKATRPVQFARPATMVATDDMRKSTGLRFATITEESARKFFKE